MTQANVLAQLGSAGVSTGFKNRIINGAMTIDQRNAGASVSVSSSSSVYNIDRFYLENITDGAFTVQQSSTVPAGFRTSALVTVTTADASLGSTQWTAYTQKIEGYNCADLDWGTANAKTVTLSFWVRSSLTGTFGGALSNQAANRSYPFTYTISSANTWEQKSVTVAGDTSGTWLTTNTTGMRVYFGLGVGSTYSGTAGAWAGSEYISATGATSVVGTNGATWYITGVQLEVGTEATDFEYRPYGTELALCQRYHWQVNGTDSDQQLFGSGTYTTTVTTARILIDVPVNLRSIPSIEAANLRLYDPAGATTRSVTGWSLYATQQASSKVGIAFTVSSSSAAPGDGCIALLNNSTSSRFALNAEL